MTSNSVQPVRTTITKQRSHGLGGTTTSPEPNQKNTNATRRLSDTKGGKQRTFLAATLKMVNAVKRFSRGETIAPSKKSEELRDQRVVKTIHRQREYVKDGERQNPQAFPYHVNQTCVLNPLANFRIKWDFSTVVMLAYVAFVTPFEIAFLDPGTNGVILTPFATALFLLNRVVDAFFVVDLILNFITGVYNEKDGQWIVKQKYITLYYFKTW